MSRVHRHRRGEGPGLGRLFLSLVVSFAAVVAIGVAIHAWNSPESPLEPAVATTVEPRAASVRQDALTGRSMPAPEVAEEVEAESGMVAGDGDGARTVALMEPTEEIRIAPPADSARSTVGTRDRAEVENPEAFSDIERPVAYEEAEALFREGRYEDAARHFAAYVEDRGENPWGLYMLGLSRWKAGRTEAAEGAFLGALDLDPDHVKSLINLARVRMELGRAEDALLPADRAVQVAPESGAALRVQARVLHNLGRREESATTYLAALAANDQDAWSMNNLGLIRIEEEEFSAAVPPLARAVELDPEVAVFHNNLGIALERVGDFEGATRSFGAALALDPVHSRAQANLSRAEQLRPTQSRETLDLAAFATAFAEEISGDRASLDAPGETLATTLPERSGDAADEQ